jgi:hypothetical protein
MGCSKSLSGAQRAGLLGVGSIRIAQASAGENAMGGIEPQPSDVAEVKIIRSGVLLQL